MNETYADDLPSDVEALDATEPGEAAAVDAPMADEAPALPKRPDEVPEKFWDEAKGTVRTAALLKSYLELEKRLGRSLPMPENEGDGDAVARLLEVLGRPASPDGYEVEAPHPLVEVDPALNERLHAAGFSQKQAQLVYDLAAERLLPAFAQAIDEVHAARQVDRLEHRFGGAEAWRMTADQIKAWGEANLDPEVLATLASSYDGVLAMHEMMRKAEPDMLGIAGSAQQPSSEAALHEMIRDPRYWRDRNPEFVQRVTEGYRRIYPE